MRKRAIMFWAIGASALLVLVLVLLLGGGKAPSGPDWPDPTIARTAKGDETDPVRIAARLARPMQTVDVYVTTCKGEMAVGATVLAEVGKESYSATTDDSGKAAVKIPADADAQRIVARRSTFNGEIAPATFAPDADLVIDICPGATLFGRVIDHWGHTHSDIALELVDANGDTLDATESDPDGNYLMSDLALGAASVRVAGELMPIDALRAGENRELDLINGQTRVVRGFVLDLAGDPIAGVLVRLEPMQFEGQGWTTVSAGNGGFSFLAPSTALRVDADGGDLGKDRAWVNEGAEKRDVELTLEPVGFITVVKKDADAQDVKVALRNWDQKAMGSDNSWAMGPRQEWQEYEVGGIDPGYSETPPYPDGEYDPTEGEGEGEAGEGEGETETEQGVEYNTTQPAYEAPSEAAMNRFMRKMVMEIAPEMMPEGADQMDMQQFSAALEARSKALTPEQLSELTTRFSTEKVQEISKRIMTEDPELAPLAKYMAMNEPQAAPEPVVEEPEVAEPITVENVEGSMDVVTDEAVADYGEGPYPDSEYEPSEMDKFGTYAEGVLNEQISVPANQWYEVYVERSDGTETRCGRVLVKAGEELTVRCGGESLDSVVEGRFVTRRGQPIANLDVWMQSNNSQSPGLYHEERQMTGADGRFRFQIAHDKPVTLTVGVGTAEDPWQGNYGRRNVVVAPGDEKDIGDLIWIPEGERPEAWPTSDYGGIGGLINLDENGVSIVDMEDESPLALAGIEKDDTIVLIDGLPAGELPQDEVFLRLRGAPGTQVDLRLRSAEGELYEVTVDRALMAKPDDIWGPDGIKNQGEVDPIYEF